MLLTIQFQLHSSDYAETGINWQGMASGWVWNKPFHPPNEAHLRSGAAVAPPGVHLDVPPCAPPGVHPGVHPGVQPAVQQLLRGVDLLQEPPGPNHLLGIAARPSAQI